MKRPVTFYSEGCKLVGDVYYPDDLQPGETRAGIVLCHGYTGVKDLYLPDNARVLNEAGYMVMTFDYKGWGESAGARSRLAPYSRVADVQAAVTFLGTLPEVDANRLGIYGTSYGGATVVWVGAIDSRVKCIVSVVGIGHGARWMRSVRRPDEWYDLLDRASEDRCQRALRGESAFAERSEILCLIGNLLNSLWLPGAITRRRSMQSPWNILMIRWALIQNGWWIKSRHVQFCLSPRTMTVSYLLRSPSIYTPGLVNPKSW